MRIRILYLGFVGSCMWGLTFPAVSQELDIEEEKVIRSERPDGRHVSTRGYIQHLICPNIERAKVNTKPDQRGVRPAANWLGHCIPGLWQWFDYPDLVASVAPRPLIITEGGPTHSLHLVQRADEIAGAPENVSIQYYPKYNDPADRRDGEPIPEGLDQAEWFEYAHVDAPRHYFKGYLAIPWLAEHFQPRDPGEVIPPAPPEAQ